jgi:hypothetical protein
MSNYLAQITNPALGSDLKGKSGVSFFQTFIPNLVGLAFVIGALVFFFVMVIAAIQWITSGGDKQALESARGKLTNAIIGFVILLLLFVILKVIQDFFGLDILSLDIGPLKI